MTKVTNLVIHEIQKEENIRGEGKYILSSKTITISKKEIEVVEELEKKYTSLPHTTAKFLDQQEDTLQRFSTDFDIYYSRKSDSFNFLELSIEATKNFLLFIDRMPSARGGFLIFVEYNKDLSRFFSVFFVRNKKGSSFSMNRSTQSYEIDDTFHVDVDNLAMASRLNLSQYDMKGSVDSRYITFINKSHVDSQYFLKWFCADDTVNNKQDTENLKKILEQIGPPLDEKGKPIMEIYQLLDNVYNHLKSKTISYEVDLHTLGKEFYQDEYKIVNFASDNNIVINSSFRAEPKVLKSFVNISATADKIRVNFPLAHIGEFVIIEDDTIIIKSAKLAQKVQVQLLENDQ